MAAKWFNSLDTNSNQNTNNKINMYALNLCRYVIFSTILLYLSQVSNKVLCNQHLHFGCTVSNSDFLWYSFLATENQWCAHCTLVFTKQQVSNHHLLSITLLYKNLGSICVTPRNFQHVLKSRDFNFLA